MNKTVAHVKELFNENKNSILLTAGYLCAVAVAFLPVFIK